MFSACVAMWQCAVADLTMDARWVKQCAPGDIFGELVLWLYTSSTYIYMYIYLYIYIYIHIFIYIYIYP